MGSPLNYSTAGSVAQPSRPDRGLDIGLQRSVRSVEDSANFGALCDADTGTAVSVTTVAEQTTTDRTAFSGQGNLFT